MHYSSFPAGSALQPEKSSAPPLHFVRWYSDADAEPAGAEYDANPDATEPPHFAELDAIAEGRPSRVTAFEQPCVVEATEAIPAPAPAQVDRVPVKGSPSSLQTPHQFARPALERDYLCRAGGLLIEAGDILPAESLYAGPERLEADRKFRAYHATAAAEGREVRGYKWDAGFESDEASAAHKKQLRRAQNRAAYEKRKMRKAATF